MSNYQRRIAVALDWADGLPTKIERAIEAAFEEGYKLAGWTGAQKGQALLLAKKAAIEELES